MAYPKIPYAIARETALLQCGRPPDQLAHIRLRRELPGNVIVIHGVNDVGTSFDAVEKGLCEGLNARLYGMRESSPAILRPADVSYPLAVVIAAAVHCPS